MSSNNIKLEEISHITFLTLDSFRIHY